MEVGRRRADVPYRWPRTLQCPARPPKLVYFDLNHWVSLAKAVSGHPDGRRFRDLLEACVRHRDQGDAVFPISDSIFFEVSKIGQYRQRRDLRDAIELVSQYFVVTSRGVISTHEVEAVLDELVGPSPRPINAMQYLDWGVARAFGMVGGFKVRDDHDNDVTDEVRQRHPDGPEAFDRVLAAAELELIRSALAGPSPEEEPELRTLGWRPGDHEGIGEQRAAQEREQAERFNADPHWRRGRIRDVVAARELGIEINRILYDGIADRGADLEDVFPDPDATRRAVDSMPSFDVSVSLKTSYHQDPSHRWTANDVHDIDALGSTVPYCDIVVTDKAVASHLRRIGVADRLGTTVLSNLEDLLDHI